MRWRAALIEARRVGNLGAMRGYDVILLRIFFVRLMLWWQKMQVNFAFTMGLTVGSERYLFLTCKQCDQARTSKPEPPFIQLKVAFVI